MEMDDEKARRGRANEACAKANDLFEQANDLFEQADRLFEQADKLLHGKVTQSQTDVRRQEDRDEISFTAETKATRWRFVRMFLRSAWTMTWEGRVKLRITSRSQ